MPGQIFRTVALPAQAAQTVHVDTHAVGVEVSQNGLSLGRAAVWYSAQVAVRLPAGLRAPQARSSTPRTPSWTAQCAQQ